MCHERSALLIGTTWCFANNAGLPAPLFDVGPRLLVGLAEEVLSEDRSNPPHDAIGLKAGDEVRRTYPDQCHRTRTFSSWVADPSAVGQMGAWGVKLAVCIHASV